MKDKNKNKEDILKSGLVNFPSGSLLICKVFLSKCVHDYQHP
jgi:hypothetical protein